MKSKYIKPTLEVIEVKTEGIIATSPTDSVNVNNEDEYTGRSYSKKRFWKDLNED